MLKEKLRNLPDVVLGIIYLIIGAVFIIFSAPITPAIPYVLGSLFILNGLFYVIKYFLYKMYKQADCSELVVAGILLALGIVFVCFPERGLELFSVFWGIHAIISGVQCLHRLLYYATRKQKWFVFLIEGIVEFTLGVMLLIEFSEGITTHLIILGVYLLIVGIFGLFGVKIEKQGEKPIVDEKGKAIGKVKSRSLFEFLAFPEIFKNKKKLKSKEKKQIHQLIEKSAKNKPILKKKVANLKISAYRTAIFDDEKSYEK